MVFAEDQSPFGAGYLKEVAACDRVLRSAGRPGVDRRDLPGGMFSNLAAGLEIEPHVIDLPLFADESAGILVVLVVAPGRMPPGEG
ncbi:MAG: hypothetical protein CME13_14240 [Gemmatimonadetes bacterium]|nr:hypothetical protein [Gemmatimonadota bacterium]HCV25120.1 hypothetical protein [Candidatus Latescibacterota bacterium]